MEKIRGAIRYVKENRKKLFWWWVAYQAIKGMLTLSLIWIPLLLLWMKNSGVFS